MTPKINHFKNYINNCQQLLSLILAVVFIIAISLNFNVVQAQESESSEQSSSSMSQDVPEDESASDQNEPLSSEPEADSIPQDEITDTDSENIATGTTEADTEDSSEQETMEEVANPDNNQTKSLDSTNSKEEQEVIASEAGLEDDNKCENPTNEQEQGAEQFELESTTEDEEPAASPTPQETTEKQAVEKNNNSSQDTAKKPQIQTPREAQQARRVIFNRPQIAQLTDGNIHEALSDLTYKHEIVIPPGRYLGSQLHLKWRGGNILSDLEVADISAEGLTLKATNPFIYNENEKKLIINFEDLNNDSIIFAKILVTVRPDADSDSITSIAKYGWLKKNAPDDNPNNSEHADRFFTNNTRPISITITPAEDEEDECSTDENCDPDEDEGSDQEDEEGDDDGDNDDDNSDEDDGEDEDSNDDEDSDSEDGSDEEPDQEEDEEEDGDDDDQDSDEKNEDPDETDNPDDEDDSEDEDSNDDEDSDSEDGSDEESDQEDEDQDNNEQSENESTNDLSPNTKPSSRSGGGSSAIGRIAQMSRSAKPEFSLASQVDPELAEEELEAEGILAINNDYKYTADRYVALAIEKPENDKIIKMRFRNQGGEWSDWQDYAPFKIWTLEGAMGVKQVDSEYLLASGQTIKAEDKIIYGKAYDYNLEVYSGDLNLGALKSAKKYSSNAELELNFKIKNLGYKTWKSTGDNSVRISYHIWQRNQDGTKGELLYWDNTHFFLSNNLELGEATNYSASLLLPHEQGEYIIEFDLVEELVTWFAHEGVSTIKVPVDLE